MNDECELKRLLFPVNEWHYLYADSCFALMLALQSQLPLTWLSRKKEEEKTNHATINHQM